MPCSNLKRSQSLRASVATALVMWFFSTSAIAAEEGGLYIAGDGFSFQRAAERALAQNPHGQRFFVLALPAEAAALTRTASQQAMSLRGRVVAAGGVLLVCQRDFDNGSIDRATLVPEIVAVRGFPPPGSSALAPGSRYFPDEKPDNLPRSDEALRRLRATCS